MEIHGSTEMPYFINPSKNLSDSEKKEAYENVKTDLHNLLLDEKDSLVKMVSINTILKTHLPYYYWVGFYMLKEGQLKIGPYQGTLGCLNIEMGRGVCGTVALTGKTKIVNDVHILEQGKEHIACDPNSRSEIVTPVFDKDKNLIAVFDVDSTLPCSFDLIDQKNIEEIMVEYFSV